MHREIQSDVKYDDLIGRVEPHILAMMRRGQYVVRHVDPSGLFTWNRLDLGLRTLYLSLLPMHHQWATLIYHHDIRAQSDGNMRDPDNPKKRCFEDYVKAFRDTHESIKSDGHDSRRTLVPLALDGSILNGGHRVAAALSLNRAVAVVDTGLRPICCDHNYFYRRAVPEVIISLATYSAIWYGTNLKLALVVTSNFALTKILATNLEGQFSNVTRKLSSTMMDRLSDDPRVQWRETDGASDVVERHSQSSPRYVWAAVLQPKSGSIPVHGQLIDALRPHQAHVCGWIVFDSREEVLGWWGELMQREGQCDVTVRGALGHHCGGGVTVRPEQLATTVLTYVDSGHVNGAQRLSYGLIRVRSRMKQLIKKSVASSWFFRQALHLRQKTMRNNIR